jgi:carbonic anhydrase
MVSSRHAYAYPSCLITWPKHVAFSVLVLAAGWLLLHPFANASEAHGATHEAPAGTSKHQAVSSDKKATHDGQEADVSQATLSDMLNKAIAQAREKHKATVVEVAPKPSHSKTRAHGRTTTSSHTAPAHGSQTSAHTPKPGSPAHASAHWDYSGEGSPERWGELSPTNVMCSLGKRQSPIDIRDGIKVDLEPITFDYRPTQFRVIDNGHTVQVNVEPGNSIVIGAKRYDLLQFHFHRPSEERINGRQFEMVAHLVHKSVDGQLAVVAVLMSQGTAHPMVQLVWNSLPLEKNTEQYGPVMLDLKAMLPEKHDYYTYMGSLTTPPCSEGVLWMVMKEPASMSPEQINIFSRLYPMNARPIQNSSGRLIKESR